jgi:hypothetical protein
MSFSWSVHFSPFDGKLGRFLGVSIDFWRDRSPSALLFKIDACELCNFPGMLEKLHIFYASILKRSAEGERKSQKLFKCPEKSYKFPV